MSDLQITSATLSSGEQVDVEVRNGVVTRVCPAGAGSVPGIPHIDLTDRILLPSFVEPHAHLDKAFLADRVSNEKGDLMGAIDGLSRIRDSLTHQDTVERATAAVRLLSRNGVTLVRSHADTTMDNGLRSIAALCEVRDNCRDFIDVQVCALLEWPLTGSAGASRRALARDALDAGADVIGGCPHLDDNPYGAVEFLLGLAIERGVPLDLHADENLRPDSRDLEILADLLISERVTHPATASHCVSLSTMEVNDVHRIAEKVAESSISVISLPHTNLYLQGRESHTTKPRGIAPVGYLLGQGVTVAAGGDNLQDPFNPMGRGDPLETASLMVMAGHVSPGAAFEMVSAGARATLGATPVDVAVGCRADFVSLPSTTLRESIAMAPHDRIVIRFGKVIDDHARNKK